MSAETILFAVLALLAVLAALGMLLSRNAVHSALFLVANFGAVAVLYLLLDAPFIALAQITVYAGAIMVLFLFVIMLLGVERLRQPERQLRWQAPAAIALAALLLVALGYVVFTQAFTFGPGQALDTAQFATPERLATTLYGAYLLPFEITSLLLLVGMVGVVVLTRDLGRAGRARWGRQPGAALRAEDVRGEAQAITGRENP